MSSTITVEELLAEFRYDDEDAPMVERKLNGAIQVLKNAGAYDESSDLLPVVLSNMVGFMLENREGVNQDFVDITMYPISLVSLINSMKYNMEVNDDEED